MNDIKNDLRECIETYTIRSSKAGREAYACPFCGSGEGENGTGALMINPKTDYTTWKCFSCGRGGDIGDFIAEIEGINPNKGLARAREIMQKTDNNHIEPTKNHAKPVKQPDTDYSAFIENAHLFVKDYHYFEDRGFSEETIERFRLGYALNEYGYVNAIIPTCKHHYIIRGIEGDFKGNEGSPRLFNPDALRNAENAPVFVCEGWADALSVEEVGGYAVAINSTENVHKFLTYLDANPSNCPFLLAMDNDDAGTRATDQLMDELEKRGYLFGIFPTAPYKDVNEWLKGDKKSFTEAVKKATAELTDSILTAYNAQYIGAQIDDILGEILGGKHGAISTGFKGLDKALDGGLFPGLTVLASESSLGKSTLVMNIAENMAENGQDILYFALEMTKPQLVARGLSKQTFLTSNKKNGFTAGQIRKNEANDLTPALNAYKKKIAPRLIIFESHGATTADDITARVEDHVKITGRVPIVIIDYLQMIYDEKRQTEKQQNDYSIGVLKGLSAKYNACVLAISSLNRASYGDRVNLDSLKESGKIEYTADFVLGLNLSAVQYNLDKKALPRDRIAEELQKEPRLMSVEVLKGRDIGIRGTADFLYYSAYSYYADLAEDQRTLDNDPKPQRFKA